MRSCRLIALAVALIFAWPAGASAAPAPVWPAATELPLSALNSVACATPGNCVAVGDSKDSTGDRQAMVVAETNGTWTPEPSEVTLPGDAAASGQNADLLSVACPSQGNCVATGYYVTTGGSEAAMIVTGTGGGWGQAVRVTLPSGAGDVRAALTSVSCTSPGNCVAGGYYTGAGTDTQAMYAIETGGGWGQASELVLPSGAMSGATQDAALTSVTCTSLGNCAGAGYYVAGSGRQAMVATETDGVWAAGAEVTLPAGASTSTQLASLESVTCTSPRDCVAVGYYADSVTHDTQAMWVTETSGAWGAASTPTLPADAAPGGQQRAYLDSVTCTAPGDCVAAGGYRDGNAAPDSQAMTATESGGTWGQAVRTAPPANASTVAGAAHAYLGAVTCTSPGACVGVGGYADTAGANQAMTVASVPALAVKTATLPPAVAGVPYTATLAATGGAAGYTWSLSSGALPGGLSLDPATGIITGTPTATASRASSFTAVVGDAGPPTQHASAGLSITVSAPPRASALLGGVTTRRAKATIIVICAGTALQKCTGTLRFTAGARHPVAVGKASYQVTGGRGFAVTVTCFANRTGRALISNHRRVATKLTLTPAGAKTATVAKAVTFSWHRGRGRA